jgi:hypothetical protein
MSENRCKFACRKSASGPPQKELILGTQARVPPKLEWNGVRTQFQIHSTEDEAAEVAGGR